MLRRGFLVLVLATGLAACDDDDTPTGPADPNLAVFTAQLSALNEVGGGTPVTTNTETSARGDVRIEFRLTRDSANAVTGATATFIVNFTGFPEGAIWRQAHIHRGVSGVPGGVVVDTGLTPAAPINLVNGGITGHRFENISVSGSLANEILTNPNGFYFNAHSVANTSGVVRGQLVRIQ
jgi:filamentous hemagglutinin family protein